jgi:spermidine/putrescine transport system permease protein
MASPYLAWALIFIIVPLGMMFYYGLTDQSGAFTMENIAAILQPVHWKSLILALELSVVSTIVCFLLAYPLGMILASNKMSSQGIITTLFILPMWMNFLLRTYAWQSILEKTGILNAFLNAIGLPSQHLINTPGGIILGMVYDFLPFMILPIYNALEKIDVNVVNAAHDLGANGTQTFTRVIFPLSLPGVISGITMVFVPALTTFVISSLLGGGKILLIGNVIEQEFTLAYDWHLGSGLSLVLLIFIILNIVVSTAFDRAEA